MNYVKELLQSDAPDMSYSNEIYIENLLHYLRANYEGDQENDHLSYQDFAKRLKVIEAKYKDKYKFLVNAGQSFKDCLFGMFSKVWEGEKNT